MVGAADGERKRVGGILGLGENGEAEQRLDHLLHLEFTRLPFSDNGELRFFRSILVDGNIRTRGGKEGHPLGHAELDGALGVFQDELRFDGDRPRFMERDQCLERFEEDFIADFKRKIGRRPDAAEIDRFCRNADQPIAGNAGPWIDAENELCHAQKVTDF